MSRNNRVLVGTSVYLLFDTINPATGLPRQPTHISVRVELDGVEVASGTPEWDTTEQSNKFLLMGNNITSAMVDATLKVIWSGDNNGHPFREAEYLRVRENIPTAPVLYETLDPAAKQIIEELKARFGDMTDNDLYGPFLEEVANFDENRYATLLKHAVQFINSKGVVTKNFTLGSFPFSSPHGEGVARMALEIECVKHFIRSLTEDADKSSVNAPAVSRRDYPDRWKNILTSLEEDFADYIIQFDRSLMDAGGVSALLDSRQMGHGYSDRVRPSVPPWWRSV